MHSCLIILGAVRVAVRAVEELPYSIYEAATQINISYQ